MTYVQQNKRNLVIAAAAAAGAPLPSSLAAEAAPARRLRLRLPQPRRMTTRTLVLAAVAAMVPVTVTATAIVHYAVTATQHVKVLSSDANGNRIEMPVIGALPAADASTWSALTRPPGEAERDADNARLLMNGQQGSGFGLNAGRARQLAVRDGYRIWLLPGNGFVCIGIRGPGDRGMGTGCNTDDAARAGALTTADGTHVFGIVPDGVRSVTVTDADTGLRHDEPVTDNVYELAYTPATVTLTVPGEQPVTFDILR